MYSVTDILPDDDGVWRGLSFDAVCIKAKLIRWTTDIEGLNVSIYIDRRIVVANSIHKFYHGNNYSNFTFSEIKLSINNICEMTGIPAKDWKLTQLEFGFNITPCISVCDLLDMCIRNGTKEFDNRRIRGKLYEKICCKYEYDLKLYDKYAEVKHRNKSILPPHNMLRVEVKYKKSKKLPFMTLDKLLHKDNLRLLFDDFCVILDKTEFNDIDTSYLNDRDLTLFHAGKGQEYWKDLRKVAKNKVRYRRKKYQQLLKNTKNISLKLELMELCKSKFKELIDR